MLYYFHKFKALLLDKCSQNGEDVF